jgi:hypothetical protein
MENRTMRINILESQIKGVIKQLDKWQKESLTGGWSTHQVTPMQKLANELRIILNKKEKNYGAKKSNSIIENL